MRLAAKQAAVESMQWQRTAQASGGGCRRQY